MKSRAPATFLIAAFASAVVWALSPWLSGHREPWDADGVFYAAALAVAGSVAGLLSPRPLWAHYLGAFVGQLGYELLALPVGPLFLLGALFLLGYSVVFAVAAAVVGKLRTHLERRPA